MVLITSGCVRQHARRGAIVIEQAFHRLLKAPGLRDRVKAEMQKAEKGQQSTPKKASVGRDRSVSQDLGGSSPAGQSRRAGTGSTGSHAAADVWAVTICDFLEGLLFSPLDQQASVRPNPCKSGTSLPFARGSAAFCD